MQTLKFVYWEEDGAWLGYLQDYPDYWTQGDTLDDLKEHLRDLDQDMTKGRATAHRSIWAALSCRYPGNWYGRTTSHDENGRGRTAW